MKLSSALIFVAFLHISLAIRTQRYTVSGKLVCGENQPAKNVLVKLYDYDFGPDIDDKLDSGYTDDRGAFSLSGETMETGRIDPRLLIFHDCLDGIKPCKRRWDLKLPKHSIGKPFNIGTWNLEYEVPEESRDCIH